MSHFNKAAADWDSPEKVEMMKILATRTMEALQPFLSGGLKRDIIDFGCGTGLFGLAFSDYARTLTGIDTAEGMLEVFEQKTSGQSHIRGILANLEQMDAAPIRDMNLKADLVLSCMAFHHLNDPETMVKKLKSFLSERGVIALVDLDLEDGTFHPDNDGMGVKHFGFGKETTAGWAEAAGLSSERKIIHEVKKNDRAYPIFLVVMKPTGA